MAKDDYFVIVYNILSYLYKCLKNDEMVDENMLIESSPLININHRYWVYVFTNLVNEGYVDGVLYQKYINGNETFINLGKCMITPKGIQYLFDNNLFEKAKKVVKDIKEMTPFL